MRFKKRSLVGKLKVENMTMTDLAKLIKETDDLIFDLYPEMREFKIWRKGANEGG